MKQILVIPCLLYSVFCQAQSETLSIKDNWGTASIFGNGDSFGYHPVNIFDTVSVVLLVTKCDDCQSESMTARAVRQKYVYSGDRMPPSNYDDYWSIVGYLTKDKQPLPNIRIWITQTIINDSMANN